MFIPTVEISRDLLIKQLAAKMRKGKILIVNNLVVLNMIIMRGILFQYDLLQFTQYCAKASLKLNRIASSEAKHVFQTLSPGVPRSQATTIHPHTVYPLLKPSASSLNYRLILRQYFFGSHNAFPFHSQRPTYVCIHYGLWVINFLGARKGKPLPKNDVNAKRLNNFMTLYWCSFLFSSFNLVVSKTTQKRSND